MAYPIHYENIQPDPTKQVFLSQVQQAPGERYWNFTHFHKMHEIIKYTDVTDGVLIINGDEFVLKPNTLVFIPSMSVHDLRFPSNTKRSWSLLQFEPDILNTLNFDTYKSFFSNPCVHNLDTITNDRFDYLFNWYKEEYHSTNSQLSSRIFSLILQIVLDMLKDEPIITSQKVITTKGIMQFTPLLVHLEKNNLYNLPLDDASKMCGLSKFHFSRLFKSYFNLNYNEYLLKRKIGMAMTQLSNPDLSITEISYSSGFNDTAYFCKKFKKETGKTPKEFRNLII